MPKTKKGNPKVTPSGGQVNEAKGPGIKIVREEEKDPIVASTDNLDRASQRRHSNNEPSLRDSPGGIAPGGEALASKKRVPKKGGSRVTFTGVETEESSGESDESTLPALDYVDEPQARHFSQPSHSPSTFGHPPVSHTAERPTMRAARSSAGVKSGNAQPSDSMPSPTAGHGYSSLPASSAFGTRGMHLPHERGWDSSKHRNSRPESTGGRAFTKHWSYTTTPAPEIPKSTGLKGWQTWRKPNDTGPPKSPDGAWHGHKQAASWNGAKIQPTTPTTPSQPAWGASNGSSSAWGVGNTASGRRSRSSVGAWGLSNNHSNSALNTQPAQKWTADNVAQAWTSGSQARSNNGHWGVGQANSSGWGNRDDDSDGSGASGESEWEDDDPATQITSAPSGGFTTRNMLSTQQHSQVLKAFLTDPYSGQDSQHDAARQHRRQSHSSRVVSPTWGQWAASNDNVQHTQPTRNYTPNLPDNRSSRSSRNYAHATNTLISNQPITHLNVPFTTEDCYLAFADSHGQALLGANDALFGRSRLARDRILWGFDPENDQRVSRILKLLDTISHHICTYGLHQFLRTRERGAFLVNIDSWFNRQPAVDWLTYTQLQQSLDRILQRSVAVNEPGKQVLVFAYLISKSGNSMAMWRHKVDIPKSASARMERQLKSTVASLPKLKDCALHLDELTQPTASTTQLPPPPPAKGSQPTRRLSKPPPPKQSKSEGKTKPKRKWWRRLVGKS